MTSAWQTLLIDFAIVCMVTVAWTWVAPRMQRLGRNAQAALLGLAMGAGAIGLMLQPLELQPGIFVDLRTSLIGAAGLSGGPVAGLVAMILAVCYRMLIGGVGAFSGVMALSFAAIVGIGAHWLVRGRALRPSEISLFSLAMSVASVMAIFFLPPPVRVVALQTAALPLFVLVFLSTGLATMTIAQERRRRELARANEIYRATIEALPDCLNAKDLDGRFLAANEATAALMRARNAADLIGKTDFDFYPVNTAQRFRNDELEILDKGEPVTIEQKATHTDGTELWLWTLKAPLRDAEGRLVGLITHNRDITDWKRLEDELNESRRRLSDALAYMADGIAMFDSEDRLVFSNANYRQMFPLTADIRIPGTLFRDIVRISAERGERADVAADISEVRLKQVVETASGFGDRQVELADGRWINVKTRPMSGGGCIRVYSDISRLKAAEAEIRATEHRWSFALESAGQGVWDFDVRAGRTYYSSVWKAHLGYGPDELSDSPSLWLDLMHPDDQAAVLTAEQANLDGTIDFFDAEFRMRHKDGHWVWIRDRGKVLEKGADGRALRAIGTHADITERKSAEERIHASEELFRSIFALSPVGLALIDIDTKRFKMQSQSLARMLGIPLEAFPGLRFSDVVASNLENVPEFSAQLDDGWQFGPVELDLVREQTAPLPVIVTGSLLLQPGQPAQMLLVFQDISARRSHEQQLWRLANIDNLTGLPNRMQFNARLDEALKRSARSGKKVALAFFDLDNFKDVNDQFGHDAGDALLQSVAARALAVIRTTDTLARLGGDEFAAIFEEIDNEVDVSRPLDEMIHAVREPIPIGGELRQHSTSVGVAIYPNDAGSPVDLMKSADIALYRAKQAGRNRYEFFRSEMRQAVDDRGRLLADVEVARTLGQVEVRFQPILANDGMRAVAVEAVPQLRHPAYGVLSPTHWRTAMAESKHALAISEVVLSKALQIASGWQKRSIDFGRMTVELTVASVRAKGFADELLHRLDRAGLEPRSFSIVIREDALFARGHDRVTSALERLHSAGVEIVLDEFGSGLASVTSLRRLPIDRIRFATNLIENLETNAGDQSIVIGLVDLVHRLGISAGATDVETIAQADFLFGIGCDQLQGNLFSGPLGESEIVLLVERGFAVEATGNAVAYL